MSKIKLAVFDVDGTLVDSQAMIIACLQRSCLEMGLTPPQSRVQLLSGVGLPLDQAVQKAVPELRPDQVAGFCVLFRRHQAELADKAEELQPLFPGCRAMLEQLHADGYKLAILTSKARKFLDIMMAHHKMTPLFYSIKTPDDGPAKPDPFLLLELFREFGVGPLDTIFVGDSTYDVETAINAKSYALGVSWGYHTAAELKQAGAHRVLDRIEDIVPTIRNWA